MEPSLAAAPSQRLKTAVSEKIVVPQIVVLVAVGAGAYLGYRWLKKRARDAAIAAARQAETARPVAERAREVGDLVWDEEAGVYRKKD